MRKLLAAAAWLWTTALLALVYFLVLGPACAAARALGWDPLALEAHGERTFWRAREDGEEGCSERTY